MRQQKAKAQTTALILEFGLSVIWHQRVNFMRGVNPHVAQLQVTLLFGRDGVPRLVVRKQPDIANLQCGIARVHDVEFFALQLRGCQHAVVLVFDARARGNAHAYTINHGHGWLKKKDIAFFGLVGETSGQRCGLVEIVGIFGIGLWVLFSHSRWQARQQQGKQQQAAPHKAQAGGRARAVVHGVYPKGGKAR